MMDAAGKASVLVVAAHPDDDVLGCGGTIARHVRRGDTVTVVFLTDGVGAREFGVADEVAARRKAGIAALNTLGVLDPIFGDLPDNQLDTIPLLQIAKAIEAVAARMDFTTVYTHHHGDLNVDHRLAHEAVMTAFRPTPGRSVKTILTFETASSTEWRTPNAGNAFLPNFFVAIDDVLDVKLAALRAYNEEMPAWPHARSVEALEYQARWRGAAVGKAAAEAFVMIRHICE